MSMTIPSTLVVLDGGKRVSESGLVPSALRLGR